MPSTACISSLTTGRTKRWLSAVLCSSYHRLKFFKYASFNWDDSKCSTEHLGFDEAKLFPRFRWWKIVVEQNERSLLRCLINVCPLEFARCQSNETSYPILSYQNILYSSSYGLITIIIRWPKLYYIIVIWFTSICSNMGKTVSFIFCLFNNIEEKDNCVCNFCSVIFRFLLISFYLNPQRNNFENAQLLLMRFLHLRPQRSS